MSNRAYLYSTNFVPGEGVEDRRIIGISEWGYDIPIVFKILLSGNPRICQSLLWDEPDVSAIVGEYDTGVARLLEFLPRIPHPAARELAEEAISVLRADQNRNRYFLLEPYEVFCLDGKTAVEFMADLADISRQMDQAIAEVTARMREEDNPPGFFARLFGARTPIRRETSTDMVYALGFGGWTNTLFYAPE